jgi:hypothetical protein
VAGVVVVVGVALVAASLAGDDGTDSPAGLASAIVVRRLQDVPPATIAAVGRGDATRLPRAIDAEPLTEGGKPLVLYIGSEYCPFCAAERWALVQALSRFGTFTGLKATSSSSADAYADTPTLSFDGETYSSPYVAFDGVELRGRELEGGQYPELERLTPERQRVFDTFSAPPYVPAQSAGAIPFIDFGGRYISTGATYDPAVLAGKSHDEIAAALADPDDPIARAVIGTANTMTAAICSLTGQQPASACDVDAIRAIQSSL